VLSSRTCFRTFLVCCHFLDLTVTWSAHTTLELVGCVVLAARYTMDAMGAFDHYENSGPGAMTVCILIDGASLVILAMNGGTASVVVHTFDRYWKIVHPIHHRTHYRRWMLYAGLFLPWLNGAATHLLPAIGTTRIVDGRCNPAAFWPTPAMAKVCNWPVVSVDFLSFYA